jgi:hypothetical protein
VTWETISPDLTANPECCQGISGEPITRDITGEEFYSTLYAIRQSPHDANVIWAGANDGPFHVTRDDGATWTDISPPDLPEGGRVNFIDPSPHRPGSAYYAVYRYLLGDYTPYIYRTDDYGRTWTRLTDGANGIPADWPTRVVREDPDREGLLYAGTEFGMFISFDNGAHWQPFQLNLPNVPITDIKVHGKDLVIATQGRGFWIIDNLTPLHQMTQQVAAEQVHVYEPRPGYRTRDGAQFRGPTLDYYLAAAPSSQVRIEILDEAGSVVNEYEARMRVRASDGQPADDQSVMMEGRPRRGAFGGGNAPQVTANTGHNRFVWDVRHASGIGAPPGRYQARLTVDGRTFTQPLEVLIDPRLADEGLTVADLREQYDHNLRMRAMVEEVNALVERVRAAQERLGNANTDAARNVQALASRLITEPVRYGKPGLQAHINYLAGMTAAVDQKIGRDAIQRYEVLRRELDAVKAEAGRVLGGE